MTIYKVLKHVHINGYPVTSKYYPECHLKATRDEIKKFGIHKFRQLGILIPLHPKEYLGSNDVHGNLFVSKIVPKKFREEVAYHECVESRCLLRKRKKN